MNERAYPGPGRVDPAIMTAGLAALPEAATLARDAALALCARCTRDMDTAAARMAGWVDAGDQVMAAGRANVLLSVLLNAAAQTARARSGTELVAFRPDPQAGPLQRAVRAAVSYVANEDPAAALDVLQAHVATAGRWEFPEMIGELVLLNAEFAGFDAAVLEQRWPP